MPGQNISAPPVRLAIFDLDRTLTRVPTWSPFLLYAAWRQSPLRLFLIGGVGIAALARAAGLIDRDRLKEVMHRLLLGPRVSLDRMAATAEAFARVFVDRYIYAEARRQLADDRAAGTRIVIASAAHHFYADAIARELGISDVVATTAMLDAHGNITHRIDGSNCYGLAKLAMIQGWLTEQGIARETAHIRFTSDHVTDIPTLEWADEAIVVNPLEAFERTARQRGWTVAKWSGR
ncbi:MAG: HAD-IB family phosphatase [Sphingobium sp.]